MSIGPDSPATIRPGPFSRMLLEYRQGIQFAGPLPGLKKLPDLPPPRKEVDPDLRVPVVAGSPIHPFFGYGIAPVALCHSWQFS